MVSSKSNDQDADMPDASRSLEVDEDPAKVEKKLDEEFPGRPKNQKLALPFHDLIEHIFNPINDIRQKPRVPGPARAKIGPHGLVKRSPKADSANVIASFIHQWRKEVGDDLYPVFRLLSPDKDSERNMYGLKETAIAKLLIKVMGIDKNSPDGQLLLRWKVPGATAAARMAGDFAGRCYEVLNKRPLRTKYGNMTVDEVNELLDQLSKVSKEADQRPIFAQFYSKMNSTELMWLVRMMLRQPLKFGVSHETIFKIFHPDAVPLYNVSSSLRKVCWTLHDPNVRLDTEDTLVTPLQCFQPQLAQFQPSKAKSFAHIVANLGPTEDDPEFWIEEKLDGERVQLHMIKNTDMVGNRQFGFWSRKAKDYTDLYGHGLFDDNAALTLYLRDAFHEGVTSIILDGEMITWDPEEDAMVGFGTLKTAVKNQAENPYVGTGHRPLYRVFDILYLNGKSLTNYTLRDRRRALEGSIRYDKEKNIHGAYRRLELHTYTAAKSADKIEPMLRKVIEEAGEGLVLKNPRSPYRLNERNDDWMKVKPEYIEELGERLDCIVVGGYYGSGRRGGTLSSFLCGLLYNRTPEDPSQGPEKLRLLDSQLSQSQPSQRPPPSTNPQFTYSFFKVGGGFKAEDYSTIRHRTEGKWHVWNPKKPPNDWIELGGQGLQYERPDMWIKPEDSIVLAVKAAAFRGSDQFRTWQTLRFPRLGLIRHDRDWTSALTIKEFEQLKQEVDRSQAEKQEKQLKIENSRRTRTTRAVKKLKVAGGTIDDAAEYAGPETKILEGLTFFVMSNSLSPFKKSKPEIEQLVKANGGAIMQTHDAAPNTICIADRQLVKVAALIKRGDINIIRPKWLFDCISQSQTDVGKPTFLPPLEPNHMLFTKDSDKEAIQSNVDEYDDSYSRDISTSELRLIFDKMEAPAPHGGFEKEAFMRQLEDHGHTFDTLRVWLFEKLTLYFDDARPDSLASDADGVPVGRSPVQLELARMTARFAAAYITEDISEPSITHVVSSSKGDDLKELRRRIMEGRRVQPRIVSPQWVLDSWDEETQLAEERYPVN